MPNLSFTRTLTLACLSAVLGCAANSLACGPADCIDDVVDIEHQLVPLAVDLHAISSTHAVGSGGTILRANVWGDDPNWVAESSPTSETLYGVSSGHDADTFIVGAAGTLIHDGELVELGTSADLFAVSVGSSRGAIVGDGVIFWTADGGDTWQAASVPAGTGELRGVFDDETRMIAVGRTGTILSSDDGGASWTAIASPSSADLWAVGRAGQDIVIVGDAGTILRINGSDGDMVEAVPNSLGGVGDLRGLAGTFNVAYAVGRAGVIVNLLAEGGPALVQSDPAQGDFTAVALEFVEGAHALLAVGAMSHATRLLSVVEISDHPACASVVPGRPLHIGGLARVAPLTVRDDWQCTSSPARPDDDALRRQLAALWSRDAALEHASVAAFARHALELLALAAPPELLSEIARAQLDEIEHARLCFALASAHAGQALGPAGLALDELGRERIGDPLAVAQELFVSGCLNETFAALEAARAAELAEDPAVIDVLVQIADDEARHAALAWRTLAWLVERFPACVPALRERATKLDDALELSLPSSASERELERHGRLGTRERELVRRQALATIVRPTLRVLTRRAASRAHRAAHAESLAPAT